MVPVDPQLKSEAGVVVIGEAGSFIDQLREGAAAPTVIGHWTSLAPPILAVMVALFFRSMIFALLSAFVAGSFGSRDLGISRLRVGDADIEFQPLHLSFPVFSGRHGPSPIEKWRFVGFGGWTGESGDESAKSLGVDRVGGRRDVFRRLFEYGGARQYDAKAFG